MGACAMRQQTNLKAWMKEATLAMTYGFAGIGVGFRAGEEKLETAATAAHSLWQSDAGEAKLCEFQAVGVPVAMAARMLMMLIVSYRLCLMLVVLYCIVLYPSDEC